MKIYTNNDEESYFENQFRTGIATRRKLDSKGIKSPKCRMVQINRKTWVSIPKNCNEQEFINKIKSIL